MRILVTELGQELFKKLRQNEVKININSGTNNQFIASYTSTENNIETESNILNQSRKSPKKSSLLQGDFIINVVKKENEISPSYAKMIHVKQQKFNFPKNIVEKYQGTDKVKTEESSSTNGKHGYQNFVFNLSKNRINFNHSVKSLIPESAFSSMIENTKKRENSKSTIYELRSPAKNKVNYLESIINKAEMRISAKHANLVNYLKSKQIVTDLFIKQLAEYDKSKFQKLNKVCQQVMVREDKQKNFNLFVKEKIKILEDNQRDYYRDALFLMERNIRTEKEILQRNNPKVEDKEKYHFVHKEVQKFWDKYNVNHINRTKHKSTRYNNESQSDILTTD
jgi:hypothetical protein